MNEMFGIDISKWQGDFDMRRAVEQEGVQFVILKCGGGDKGLYKDKQFEDNYKKAKTLGIPVGTYFYSKALSLDDARKEAEYCYSLISNKQFELPIYIDVEEKAMFALGSEKLCSIVNVFCEYMEARKYYVGIYSSSSYFKTHLNKLDRYTKWIAQWNSTKPANCALWQFGGETNKIRSNKINGITVDQDYLYTDFMSVIKRLKLNGFGRKTEEEIACEIVDGKGNWGNGPERMENLRKAGYDYAVVQAIVNQLVKAR